MSEYTYNLKAKLLLNYISLILFISAIALTLYTSFSTYYIDTTNRLFFVSLCLLIASGIYLKTHPRKSVVKVDDNEVFFYKRTDKQIVESSLRFSNIKSIKCIYKKKLNNIGSKKILIETGLKEICIDINYYENYKALLEKITAQINKKTDVSVPNGVMELVK